MGQVYSTAQAAKLTGISEGTVRNYVRFPQYVGYFTQGANPAPGQPRQLTEADLTLLAFIRERTAAGAPHDQIAAQIAGGELVGFTWSISEAAAKAGQPAPEDAAQGDHWGTAAEPAPLAIMAQSLTAELAAARSREQALWDRVIAESTARARAEGQLEAAQVQLAELKAAQGRSFWRRLFGG